MLPGIVRIRVAARWIMAAFYLAAGIIHVARPGTFLPIMPAWVPYPLAVVLGTGACEIAGAIGLVVPLLRRAAGIGLAFYAICVFPANIKHALDGLPPGEVQLTWWYHAPRLAFQPVLVWWALWVGEVVAWPFGRRLQVVTSPTAESLPEPRENEHG
jgi:uncharacterized membrane protein